VWVNPNFFRIGGKGRGQLAGFWFLRRGEGAWPDATKKREKSKLKKGGGGTFLPISLAKYEADFVPKRGQKEKVAHLRGRGGTGGEGKSTPHANA